MKNIIHQITTQNNNDIITTITFHNIIEMDPVIIKLCLHLINIII